jgi:RNase P subunit RPR2
MKGMFYDSTYKIHLDKYAESIQCKKCGNIIYQTNHVSIPDNHKIIQYIYSCHNCKIEYYWDCF